MKFLRWWGLRQISHRSLPVCARATLVLACASALVASCASVPHVSPAVGHAAAAQTPQIVTRTHPLGPDEIKRLVANITVSPGEDVLLRHHLAIEQAVVGGPLVEGETTHMLKDGPATFHAIFGAIAGAKQRIDLEYYIFQDVEDKGVHIGDLLMKKRAEGVTINIIYDDFGSMPTPGAFFRRLRASGVNVVRFNPLSPFRTVIGWKPNHRDHRKILVVDGTSAIVGGVNLATEYEAHGSAGSGAVPGEDSRPWRDTDIAISGPAVIQLERVFVEHWRSQLGPVIADVVDLPPVPGPRGNSVVRFIGSTPDHRVPRYYVTLISAIRSAEKSVTADAAYFVPTGDEMAALTDAARRGVDVTMILPDKSDSPLSLAVGKAHYGALIRAGVKIYERHGVVLHSKTLTVDGVWSVVGSSNFDHRSVVFNDEVDAIVLGSETAGELEAMAAQDKAHAVPVDLNAWRHRPFGERVKETFAKAVQILL